ncbi:hypothetical protein HK099_001008 [Clydaea vesicula]|uniref:Vacuolar membrane protein n=1 Tax=Clydaea vesicula TaxID=447962 RepID=A0AAD5U5H6_9FUNG|nr:hypothetical protein HK099_001008 [Clydaea vesicula]
MSKITQPTPISQILTSETPSAPNTPEVLTCQLMDSFAVIVQVFMASIALSSLICIDFFLKKFMKIINRHVVKRQREIPKRPLLIWTLDTSKQALAACMIHFANIAISSISSYISGEELDGEGKGVANPCVWYFLNILLDTTIGVGILYFFLKMFHAIAEYYNVQDIKSGVYGNPPRIKAWLKQLGLFLLSWFCVKVVVVISLNVFPFLSKIAELLLSPLTQSGNTKLQVLFVMLIFPLIMNIIQAWLIDMVIKGKLFKEAEEEDLLQFEDDEYEYENVLNFQESTHSRNITQNSDDVENGVLLAKKKRSNKKIRSMKNSNEIHKNNSNSDSDLEASSNFIDDELCGTDNLNLLSDAHKRVISNTNDNGKGSRKK